MISSLIQSIAVRFGCRVLPIWRVSGLPMATKLSRIFDEYDIDTVIDVGAHKGEFGGFLRKEVGFRGTIESFEPVPEFADALAPLAEADANWIVHRCALGAQVGEVSMNVTAGPRYSSIRAPRRIGDSYHDERTRVTATVKVSISTLDCEFSGNRDLRRTYLKLDTQGYDLEVLAGGRKAMSEIRAAQTEVSFRALYDGMPNYQESIAAFEALGYSVADFFLVASDSKLKALEFDCILVR